MLSTVSPTRLSQSAICAGATPNFSRTAAGSSTSYGLAIVLTQVTRSLTSCARSLSPVEITTLRPSRDAMCATVPIASSASMPGSSITGQPSSRMISRTGSICSARSDGITVRVAL